MHLIECMRGKGEEAVQVIQEIVSVSVHEFES